MHWPFASTRVRDVPQQPERDSAAPGSTELPGPWGPCSPRRGGTDFPLGNKLSVILTPPRHKEKPYLIGLLLGSNELKDIKIMAPAWHLCVSGVRGSLSSFLQELKGLSVSSHNDKPFNLDVSRNSFRVAKVV